MTRYNYVTVNNMSREQLLDHIKQSESNIRTLIQRGDRQLATLSKNRSTIEQLENALKQVTEERDALQASLVEAEERLARAERLFNTP